MDRPALEHRITAHDEGVRLDRWLRRLLPQMPLGAIFKHLRAGRVRVDGAKAKQDLRLQAGMVVLLQLPKADIEAVLAAPPKRTAPRTTGRERERERVAFRGDEPRVVFRDRDVLIVDKPGGLRAQPGSGADGRDLVTWLDTRGHGTRTSTFAPAPAHRLDRGTSGLVAIGLTPAGLRGLTAAFRADSARKIYLAVVHGVPRPAHGTIDAPLRELGDVGAQAQKVVVDAEGKPARTDYETVQVRGDRTLLRLRLHTGRKHQIRAHLASIGHPIVGDQRYGSPVKLGDAFLLHAAELVLPHPITGAELRAEAPPPAMFGRME